jgi:hypothetical protein
MLIKYDAFDDPNPICGINNTYNANRTCALRFVAPRYLEPPVLVYYELDNFHQNHRTYSKSFDAYQLYGKVGARDPRSRAYCEPLYKLGNITLNPCGLIANTLFNDYFTVLKGNDVHGQRLTLIEEGIAWQSDLEYMYNQPKGFKYAACPACDKTCCQGSEWSCKAPYVDKKSGTCYQYFYPDDESTQYLHETYPDIISPLEGVTNEHFVVWMKVAPQPRFRKLYGWFNQPIAQGEEIVIQVNANYAVAPFKGYKALVVATTNIFGGVNPYLGPYFIWVGGSFLVVGALFALKMAIRPRRLADRSYLHPKQD